MIVTKHKDILFIEGEYSSNCINKKFIETRTKGLGNQLKTLDDLKDEFCSIINNENVKYNVVAGFSYGQHQRLLSIDDVCFYGSGTLLQVTNEEYESLLWKVQKESDLQKIYVLKNEILAINKPVQINKSALYTFKDNSIGQVQFVNLSDTKIKKVTLEVNAYSFNSKETNDPLAFEITNTNSMDSKYFGDDFKIILDKSIRSFESKIIKIETIDGQVVDYTDAKYKEFDRTTRLLSKIKLNEKQFNFLNVKFNTNINYNSIHPNCSDGIVVDFNGDIDVADFSYFQKILDYMLSKNFHNDVAENEKRKEKEIVINQQKSFSKLYLFLGILSSLLLFFMLLSNSKSLYNHIDVETVVVFGGLFTIIYLLSSIIIDIYILIKNITNTRNLLIIVHLLLIWFWWFTSSIFGGSFLLTILVLIIATLIDLYLFKLSIE